MAESYMVGREPAGPRLSAAVPQSSVVADHRPPAVSQRTRRGGAQQQQEQEQRTRRREALEQEVAELKQQLSNEQTVHRILERALHQRPASSSSSSSSIIPAFIPTKAKELLAELLLVEEEIARLEDQIQTMKKHMSSSSGGIMTTTMLAPPRRPCPSAADNQPPTPPEFKSMFFISQAMAMDGDYDLNHHHANNKSPKAAAAAAMMSGSPNPKKKNSNDISFALPPHQPRHSLDKQKQQQQLATSIKILHELPIIVSKTKTNTKNTTSTTSRAADQQQQHPNKLSEKILKCLVCIFIRMLRSSRLAGDLDTRSGGNLAAGSFRIDTSLNVAAAKNHDYKQDRQQDHYGIFAIDDAIVRDVGPYRNLVSFTSTALDLRGFSSSPLLTKLRDMLQALQRVDLRSLTHNHKLAFWLNVYNTCIMHGILQHGLPSNSDKLLALKNKATINVSGQTFNALVIENFILRQPSSVKQEFWKCDVDVEEQQVRELYGLKSSEPNILFALCCGIRSSPALRIYKADRVSMDLEKAKLEYLQASLVVTSTRRLLIPSLIHSNMHDFAKDMESLLRWICEQLPTSWSLRKSMVDCLRGGHHLKMEEVVDVIPFDYDFQYLLPSIKSMVDCLRGGHHLKMEEVVDVIPFDYDFRYLQHVGCVLGSIFSLAAGAIPNPSAMRGGARHTSSSPAYHHHGGKGKGNPCLTMHQPWASLLVHGIKRVEGRSWPSPITGRLWIHAASKVPDPDTIKAMEDFYREIYAVDGITHINFPDHYPVSRLLGCVEVVGCLRSQELACWEDVPQSVRLEALTDFCWLCENPQKLVVPFEMRGYQGVYNLERRIYDGAVRGLTPVHGPLPVNFPLPDPRDPFSLKPGSLRFDASKSTLQQSPSVTAAVAGARAAATQFSNKDHNASISSASRVREQSWGNLADSHASNGNLLSIAQGSPAYLQNQDQPSIFRSTAAYSQNLNTEPRRSPRLECAPPPSRLVTVALKELKQLSVRERGGGGQSAGRS